jgi:hypothetical protein
MRSLYPVPISWSGLACSAFARHYSRNRFLLSFPRGTEMFHFPRFARSHLFIQCGVRRHYPPWVSPFGHRRIKAWLAAPRRFSQLPTSFLASCRLGIHRVPFVAWSFLFFVHFLLPEDQGPAQSLDHAGVTSLPTCTYPIFKDHPANLLRMEPIGIEPTTSSLQSWRSPS